MATNDTGYRYIGMGLVAENKAIESKVILYTPIEDTPAQNGHLVSENQRLESKYKDAQGNEQTATLYTNNARPATWLPDDTFRLTAPDVRRGEQVRLYRYGDSQLVYWKEMGTGKHKRRGETIVLGASGRLNLGDANTTADEDAIENHYRIEISGNKKLINIATSGANSEVSLYSLLLDGGNGIITLGDADGNELTLNTREKQWALRNSEGTYVVLDKKNMMLGSDDSIYIQSTENIAIETKNMFIKCQHLGIDAENIESSATQWNHTGNFNVNGNWTFTGEGKAEGNLGVTGKVTADEDVQSGNITLRGHYHTAQGQYSDTTTSRQ